MRICGLEILDELNRGYRCNFNLFFITVFIWDGIHQQPDIPVRPHLTILSEFRRNLYLLDQSIGHGLQLWYGFERLTGKIRKYLQGEKGLKRIGPAIDFNLKV